MAYEVITKAKDVGELKWWGFDQNNSGGYYIQNDDVDELVFIQARSFQEVMYISNKIFEDNSDYCECCGKRWSIPNKKEGSLEPEMFGKPLESFEFYSKNGAAILYYHNGSVMRYTKEG